ncbi:TPA: hypothetical protein ACKP5H_002659 [Stenotrophomonas maltophilia]
MGNYIGHIHLDVRGALTNMSKRELANLFSNASTGRGLTAEEARSVLLDHLEAGHKVIPLGKPCEGFDYAGGGCPGHEVTSHG